LASYESSPAAERGTSAPGTGPEQPLRNAAYINIGVAAMFLAAQLSDLVSQWFGAAPAPRGHIGDPRIAMGIVLATVTVTASAALALRARERASQSALRELDAIDEVVARARATAGRIAQFHDE
jgi:hypothetical protein